MLMVIGGIVLLYKGTITLKDANPNEAIKVEFKRMINVTTRYPALAFFIIGFAFTASALWFGKREVTPRLTIQGKLISDDSDFDAGSATYDICIDKLVQGHSVGSNGRIYELLEPEVARLNLEIVVPNHEPGTIHQPLAKAEAKHGILDFGNVAVGKKVIDYKPNPDHNDIEKLTESVPPLKEGGKN